MLKCDDRKLQHLMSRSLEAEPEARVWVPEIYRGNLRGAVVPGEG